MRLNPGFLECDLRFPENKLLSQHHCSIERDPTDDSRAWFVDQSTNGTIINEQKKIHKEVIIFTIILCLILFYRDLINISGYYSIVFSIRKQKRKPKN